MTMGIQMIIPMMGNSNKAKSAWVHTANDVLM